MKVLSVLMNFAVSALALSRTSAPSGALVVGSGQKYTTSQYNPTSPTDVTSY